MTQLPSPELRLPPLSPSRGTLSAVLRCACVLLLGAVIGASGTVLLGRAILRYWAATTQEWPERAARRAATVLSLDDQERAAMKQVFSERFAAIQQIRSEFRPRIRAEFDRLESEGAARLPPLKAAGWKAFMARVRTNYLLTDSALDADLKSSRRE